MRLDAGRVLTGAKPQLPGKPKRAGHPDRHRLAVNKARRVVVRQALQGVPEGVAEIEQRPLALLGLVGDHDPRLGRAARRDRLRTRRSAGKDLAPARFEKFEKIPVVDQAVFDHLGVAGAELPLAQRVEGAGIGKDEGGLVERADQVLAVRRVDARLAADAGIDLRQEGGGNLNEAHAAAQRGGAEAGQVADHPAAERDDDVPPFDARLDQRVGDAGELLIGFGRLARRAYDRGRAEARRGEALRQPVEVERRDMRVGDDRAFGPRGNARDLGSGLVDHARADEDRIGARAERNLDPPPVRRRVLRRAHNSSARRRSVRSTTDSCGPSRDSMMMSASA